MVLVIVVEAYSEEWPVWFGQIAAELRTAVAGIPCSVVEHVGSTSVPGLAAKPIIDVDVVVPVDHIGSAIEALESIGYRHQGDLGVAGREAFGSPDEVPRRHVYVCATGTLHLRNHLAVRDVLRASAGLRREYGAVKVALAANADIDVQTYVARKSQMLQKVLAESDLTAEERLQIWRLNDPSE